MFEFVVEQLQNQFLSGGLVLMAFGSIIAVGRGIPGKLFTLFLRRFVMTIDVSDHDEAFFWLQEWMAQHEYSKKSRLLTVSTRKGHRDNIGIIKDIEDDLEAPPIFFSPAPGKHLLRFEGHWMLLTRTRSESRGSSSQQHWREMFTIQTFCQDHDLVRRR